jgi:hypothetical protein
MNGSVAHGGKLFSRTSRITIINVISPASSSHLPHDDTMGGSLGHDDSMTVGNGEGADDFDDGPSLPGR